MNESEKEIATFGGGCFWCTEAFFSELEGVELVKSGYSGGHIKNPAYREVCTGRTGHAEVIEIEFNPRKIGFETLLKVFFKMHDPTSLNRQGGDVGTQYRSVIFHHNDDQKKLAELAIKAANESGIWEKPVVTDITPFEAFYPAENNHDNYFALNPNQPYCVAVIRPKMDKFISLFSNLMKEHTKV